MSLVRLSRSFNQMSKNVLINCSRVIQQPIHHHSQVAGNDEDMPVEMENPFKKERPQCILCKYDIEVNYKNPRLLSQFVSPYTGLPYDRHVTGLCERQQQLVNHEIKRAVVMGFLPKHYRKPEYKNDPKLFDTFKPQRANPY